MSKSEQPLSEAEKAIQDQLGVMEEALKPYNEQLKQIDENRQERKKKGETLTGKQQAQEDIEVKTIEIAKTNLVEERLKEINNLIDGAPELDKKKLVLKVIEKIPDDIFADTQAEIAEDLQKKISIDDRHAVLDDIKGKLNSPDIIKDAKKVGGPEMAEFVEYRIKEMSKSMAENDKKMGEEIKKIEEKPRLVGDKPVSQSDREGRITEIKEKYLYQKAQLISSTAESIDKEMTEGQKKAEKSVSVSKRIFRIAAVVGHAIIAAVNDRPDFSQAVWKLKSTEKSRKESIDTAKKMSKEIKEYLSDLVGVQAGKRIEAHRSQQNDKGKGR